MKNIPSLSSIIFFLTLPTLHAAQVAVLTGNHVPSSSVIEAPNTVSYAVLFTTVVFPATSWIADDGFLKMTTAANRGIWFGSHPTSGSDPGGFLPGSSLAGNKLQLDALLTSGSQSWAAYFHDTDGYRARIDFEATDNNQNRPGVTVELATGFVTVSSPTFDLSQLHSYEIHLHNGIVAYSINGVEVLRGPAIQSMETASVIVGDPSGSTPTGTGSMWIDYFSFNNAAGPIDVVPEPTTTALCALAASLFATRRRRVG